MIVEGAEAKLTKLFFEEDMNQYFNLPINKMLIAKVKIIVQSVGLNVTANQIADNIESVYWGFGGRDPEPNKIKYLEPEYKTDPMLFCDDDWYSDGGYAIWFYVLARSRKLTTDLIQQLFKEQEISRDTYIKILKINKHLPEDLDLWVRLQ